MEFRKTVTFFIKPLVKEAVKNSFFFFYKYNLVIVLGIFASNLFAQTISGIVKDSLQNPLAYTNIIATPQSENTSMAYAIADEKGRFKLVLEKDVTYMVRVSYLGYKPYSFSVTLLEDKKRDIVLKTAENELEEVIVISDIPVTVKEDTIRYKTDVFKTGSERKLKQVLEKLPGIEVDKDGGVTVMGKKVNKLLVDNKPFFGGNTKLGVENIPADAVDEVEAIDNYNEVAFLKGLSDSEKMALNIKLKKDKKRFLFGDIEAGAGMDKHYLVHPNVFYYSPKTNVNFIGDLNDIGTKSFTIKDYLDFEGGLGKMISDPSSYFKLSKNDFSKFLGNTDFKSGKNKFGAVNISQAINKKWDISGYSIYSNTVNDTQVETINEYLAQNEETVESKTENGTVNNTFFMGKIALDYIPSIDDDISYSGFFKSSHNKSSDNLSSITPDRTINLEAGAKDHSVTVKQNTEWHKKLSRKHTASLAVNYGYDKNNPETNWRTNQPILQGLIPLQNDSIFNINQDKSLKIHHLNLHFKHYWVLNRSNHIYTSIGNNLLDEHYTTDEFQQLTDGSINNFNPSGFGNDLYFNMNDFFIGVQHKFRIGMTTVKYGVSAHHYNWKADQSSVTKRNKWLLLPDFSTKIKFNSAEKISFNYNLKSTFSDAPSYANGFTLRNYNSVYRGNEDLENELYHSARLLYTKFSLYRGVILSGSGSYSKKIKSQRNRVQLQGIDRFSSPIIADNPETSWQFYGNIRKTLGKFIFKAKGNLVLSDYFQDVNGLLSKNKSNSKGFGLELATNFKKWPNLEIGFDKNFNNYSSGNAISKFTSENPYVNLEFDFLENFILEADYSHNLYKDDMGQKNRYEVANVSLFYQKEDSPWGFKISGSNILGANYKNKNSFSEYIISDQKTYILPRIWLFSVIYKL